MEIEKLIKIYEKFKYGEEIYHRLMKKRVKEILLISTFYNSFALEENIKFSEHIIGSYHQFNLTTIPKITTAINSSHALEILKKEKFELIISTLQIGDPGPVKLAEIIKEKYPDTAFLLLLTEKCDVSILENLKKSKIDKIFYWTGDSRLLLSMIKLIEDTWNAPEDTINGPTSVILLIEDSLNYYSVYLPELLKEVMLQTQRLIKEEADNQLKYLRMRTRPKILLATTREEAEQLYERYKNYLLCIISDIQLESDDDEFGLELVEKMKTEDSDVPILIQSSEPTLLKKAKKMGVDISYKNSPFVLNELRKFLLEKCGFGDFIFRNEKGEEIARARSLTEFEEKLKQIPIDSFAYHANRKHYCMWLLTRGELKLAQKLRKIKKDKFKRPEDHRKFLINVLKNMRNKLIRGKVLDFKEDLINEKDIILKIGEGSLGGKGRGLAFLNAFLTVARIKKKFENVHIDIPKSFVICTSYFDKFIENNYLYLDFDFHSDEDIKKIFLSSDLPKDLEDKLKIIVKNIKNPLIVRSSGLLEDSQFHPFAGIYHSIIIPNNSESEDERLKHITDAIKLVYASVYFKEARSYLQRINLNIEEEKMAVIIQEVTGKLHENYFYPHFSGVVQSYNYYPISYITHDDGIANVAVGLGKYVVEGEKCFRFCPKYPEVDYISNEELIKNSQTDFYALDLNKTPDSVEHEDSFLVKLPIEEAKKHGVLNYIASTYDFINQRIVPGIRGKGALIINFANIIKYDYFPFAEILNKLVELSKTAMGSEVEIEFAVNMKERIEFKVLQVRPLISYETLKIEDIDKIERNKILLYTEKGLGHGTVEDIYTIIFVDPDSFDKTKTLEIKQEINEINKIFLEKKENYILIGPGRWGSRDRFLGIPVDWSDINMAKVIVEAGLKDFDIDPSQGTHFMHNVISLNLGYLNVPYNKEYAFIDWNWIKKQKIEIQKKYVKVITSSNIFKVIMDSKKGKFAILKSL